ncbi:unnamed protein product [Colias eurytheme]|nr:unnamed protein product [Colias eurytheme]
MFHITLLFLTSVFNSVWSDGVTRAGPVFTEEPPALVRFARTAGARVACAARAARPAPPPRLTWLADDGAPLTDLPGVRRIYPNGTLELLPAGGFAAGGLPGGPRLVRCRADNAHGTIVSRDVHIVPVADGNWEVTVEAPAAGAGGVAALTCRVSGAPARAALWYRADSVLSVDAPSPESRYLSAGDTLLIRGVSAADAGAYSCLARHDLTALTKRSRPALLDVLPSSAGSAPRVVSPARELAPPAGALLCLPCASTDYPPPHYTWYRESQGRLQPVEASSTAWLWSGGAALCLRAGRDTSGAWLCKAFNVFGDATAQIRLDVQLDITVDVQPEVTVAEAGSTVRLNCSTNEPGASLQWLHNGAALAGAAGGALVLRGAARAHAGVYQCVARAGLRSAQASAELRLGNSPPELQYTFIEQALRAGGPVALRCAAAASPPPAFVWLLDSQPLDRYIARHRYSISEETTVSGEVVSLLNISAAAAADGGRYTCRAHNPLGAVEHSARLNIYGPPSVRPLGPVRAVAGDNLTLLCPYAGYPISSVRWSRRGGAALGGAGRVVARGAALSLAPALPQDAGHYACSVSAPPAHPASRDIEIQVRNPPKISPFMFSPELTEGSSVQVLCGVSSGDKPMYFSWLKDGAPLPPNLQIEEKSLNEFSLLMFSELTAQHSGAYTCRVANHAATVNYTASLTVKVAPSWVTEAVDSAVLLGAPLQLECVAKGYPTPIVTWYRRIDGVNGLEGSERWEVTGSEWGTAGDEQSEGTGRAALAARVVSRSHQGLYRCSADNGVGPPLVKHVNITVHEPANFGTSSEVARNITSVRGQSAVLSCIARGDSPLTLHWTHREQRLDLDSYRWTISEVRTVEGVRSSLTLRSADREDAGEYRCHAANKYGRSDLLLFLHVEEPPGAPRSLQLWGVGAGWARVRWRARRAAAALFAALVAPLHALPAHLTSDPAHATYNLTLDLSDDKIDVDGSSILNAKIENLRAATTYSLRIVASNHIGQSPQSDALIFTTLEEAPNGSPLNVRIRPINSGEVHISWSAPAQDSWNGELLGYVVSWRELREAAGGSTGGGVGEGADAGSAVARGWSSAELVLGGLRQFRRYALAVRAFNRAGSGPPSPTLYTTTADGVPEDAPSQVSCEAVSARSLRVRWAPPHAAHAPLGYDVLYAPMYFSQSWSGAVRSQTARAAGGEALLQGLRAAANYSVSVRARSDRGPGPPSAPVYCLTREDVPGAPELVRALPSSAQSVRVAWLAPTERAGRLTHYTLYTRELGKVGGEWSQRVEASGPAGEGWEGEEELSHDVRGLRERAVYEFWVRASTGAGAGPPSRAVTAAPTPLGVARISSLGRVVRAPLGARVRLPCAALGAAPLLRRWAPLPPAHSVSDAGDLIIHKLDEKWSRNYTCSVRNSGGGDVAQFSVQALRPPATPSPRLARAAHHRLHLAWDPPHAGGAPLLGYTVWWWEGWEGREAGAARALRVPAGEAGTALYGLACGAPYSAALSAHNAVGASPPSSPLKLRTRGDKAKAPSGKESIWANSSALRVSLLAWGGRCPVASWRVAVRAAGGAWADLRTDGETVHVNSLEPATWYEIRILARSPAGDTPALYRAATRAHTGEQIGEPIDLPLEARMSAADGGAEAEPRGERGWGRAGLAAALGGAALALLAAAALLLLACRRHAPPRHYALPQPTHNNGKTLDPPDNDMHEISPYATFSMSSGACESAGSAGGVCGAVGGSAGARSERSCALHLRSFAREPIELAAPPPRPHLLAHPNDYGSARDTDSESSGSPCAACAAELYRLPAAHLSDTLPAGATTAAESSTEDGSYGSRRARDSQPRARARRRDHARPAHAPTVRYIAPAPGQRELL